MQFLQLCVATVVLFFSISAEGARPTSAPIPADIRLRVESDEAYFAGAYSVWLNQRYKQAKRRADFSAESFGERSGMSLANFYRIKSLVKIAPRNTTRAHARGIWESEEEALHMAGYTHREPHFHLWLNYWLNRFGLSGTAIWDVAEIDKGYFSELSRGRAIHRQKKTVLPCVPTRVIALLIARTFPFDPTVRVERENEALSAAGYLTLIDAKPTEEPDWSRSPYLRSNSAPDQLTESGCAERIGVPAE